MKTDWFVWPMMPVYVGFYERKYNGGTMLDWWNGEKWMEGRWQDAYPCINQCLPWRGMAEEPNARP